MDEEFCRDLAKKCYQKTSEMIEEMKSDPHMMQKLYRELYIDVPRRIQLEKTKYEQNLQRKSDVEKKTNIFLQVFLNKFKFFYLPTTQQYYHYDYDTCIMRNRYVIVDAHFIESTLFFQLSGNRQRCCYTDHEVVATLSEHRVTVRHSLFRRIKQRPLYSSVPESDTIQMVLNFLCMHAFECKSMAKYFLTIVGDLLLRKAATATATAASVGSGGDGEVESLTFFCTSPMLTKWLGHMKQDASGVGSSSCVAGRFNLDNFVTKYHESQQFHLLRLLKISDHFCVNLWSDFVRNGGALAFFCVAMHYSQRYGSAEAYLQTKADAELQAYVLALTGKTPEDMVNEFADAYLEWSTGEDAKVDWKSMHFLWKEYLQVRHLPSVIYSATLKGLLRTHVNSRGNYDDAKEVFHGVTSSSLPAHKEFVRFWRETVTEMDSGDAVAATSETGLSDSVSAAATVPGFEDAADAAKTAGSAAGGLSPIILNAFELDEIHAMFKHWSRNKYVLSDAMVVKLLRHFFDVYTDTTNRYVFFVTCTLWNKAEDMEMFLCRFCLTLTSMNSEARAEQYPTDLISLDDFYIHYQTFCASTPGIIFVNSKMYFQMYMTHRHAACIEMTDFVNVDKLIACMA